MLTNPLVIIEPVDSVEPFMGLEQLKSNVCVVRGIVREKLIFKTRPNIVIGALGSDSEGEEEDLIVTERVRN